MSQPPEKAQAPDQFAEKKLAAPPTTVRKDDAPRAPDPDDASRDVERLKRESPPAPSAEPQAGGKLAAPPARAERERGVAQESQRLPAAPAPESRAFSSTAASVAAPDVSGRLAVADETAALRSLAHLVDRLGAVENRRVPGDAGPIIEVTVPREAYAEFVRELTRLGRWEVTREAATLPAQVRVVLQITG
jgi:hypothetical protein